MEVDDGAFHRSLSFLRPVLLAIIERKIDIYFPLKFLFVLGHTVTMN